MAFGWMVGSRRSRFGRGLKDVIAEVEEGVEV